MAAKLLVLRFMAARLLFLLAVALLLRFCLSSLLATKLWVPVLAATLLRRIKSLQPFSDGGGNGFAVVFGEDAVMHFGLLYFGSGGRVELFGGAVVSGCGGSSFSGGGGLRKVTDDMKSKNRTGRTGVVTAEGKETRTAPSFGSTKGPAKLELQMGRKWVVEHQIGNKSLIIEECDTKQSVYAYGCKDSVLQVKGKVNNITIDKCTKVGVLFKGVVAAFEVVNCNSVEVQCEGSVPTISIDNTSGCQLYLSKESLDTSITTAKSSEINALIPDANSDGDWAEHSLPQQYIHAFKDGQFTTSPVSHSGA